MSNNFKHKISSAVTDRYAYDTFITPIVFKNKEKIKEENEEKSRVRVEIEEKS